MCQSRLALQSKGGAPEKHTLIAVDLAESVLEIAVSHEDGKVAKRRRLPRSAFFDFFANSPEATVIMEACGSAHFWGRQLARLGHRSTVHLRRQAGASARGLVRPVPRLLSLLSEPTTVTRRAFGVDQDPPIAELETLAWSLRVRGDMRAVQSALGLEPETRRCHAGCSTRRVSGAGKPVAATALRGLARFATTLARSANDRNAPAE